MRDTNERREVEKTTRKHDSPVDEYEDVGRSSAAAAATAAAAAADRARLIELVKLVLQPQDLLSLLGRVMRGALGNIRLLEQLLWCDEWSATPARFGARASRRTSGITHSPRLLQFSLELLGVGSKIFHLLLLEGSIQGGRRLSLSCLRRLETLVGLGQAKLVVEQTSDEGVLLRYHPVMLERD